MKNQVILTISGKQCVDALPAVMRLISSDPDAVLSDFGQFVVRDRFLATALITTAYPERTVKDILYGAQEYRREDDTFQVEYSYPPTGTDPSASSLSAIPPSTEELVLTVFAPSSIPPRFLASLTSVIKDHDGTIFNVDRLTGDKDPFMSLQLRLAIPMAHSLAEVQRALFDAGRQHPNCDMALQRANVMRNAKRLVVFDLSWTLVECDAINVLLSACDLAAPAALTEQFDRGELSRPDMLRARAQLLKGQDARLAYGKAVAGMEYTTGANELCKGLRRLGCRLAVVSSGCKLISDTAKEALGLDYAFGNDLEVDTNGKFTGHVMEPIIDVERKAELVQMLAMQERIDTEQIVVVGDGPVSSKMLASAGMSIAFDQPGATDDMRSGHISSRSLASVLYLLGVTV